MARRPPPRLVRALAAPPLLSRAVKVIGDWRVLVGAVIGVFMLIGTAFAFKDSLATKADVAPMAAHLQRHDVEFEGFRQALEDIRETVHQIHDDQRLQTSPHR